MSKLDVNDVVSVLFMITWLQDDVESHASARFACVYVARGCSRTVWFPCPRDGRTYVRARVEIWGGCDDASIGGLRTQVIQISPGATSVAICVSRGEYGIVSESLS